MARPTNEKDEPDCDTDMLRDCINPRELAALQRREIRRLQREECEAMRLLQQVIHDLPQIQRREIRRLQREEREAMRLLRQTLRSSTTVRFERPSRPA